MIFRNNAYWKRDTGPFCSRCKDVDNKEIRLVHIEDSDFVCTYCGTEVNLGENCEV